MFFVVFGIAIVLVTDFIGSCTSQPQTNGNPAFLIFPRHRYVYPFMNLCLLSTVIEHVLDHVLVNNDVPASYTSVCGASVMSSAIFYIGHRLLHTAILYKHVHHYHHRYRVCTSTSSSLYCHPIELVIGNILPLLVPPVTMKFSYDQTWWYIIFGFLLAVSSHTPDTAASHGMHHMDGRRNFGLSVSIMDRICGTHRNN
jgi:sterol desaturase/sphingolipid hydroxylase (fatty acid hydroxylase superfamily)